jgi:alkyldihydroxyacetonephosphate synthase
MGRQMSNRNPHRNDDRQNGRIHPAAPARRAKDELSLDVWGYRDSGFVVSPDGEVTFKGDRYDISGTAMPDLLPWAGGVMGVTLEPFDVCQSSYPPEVPERIVNSGFEAALGSRLSENQVSSDPLLRLRRGHGHTQEEMWAIKHGRVERVPDLVVFAESESDVCAIVEEARRHAVCLIPYGGGTNVTDALRCPTEETRSIVSLDVSRMNRVLWIDPENHLACIEAGATGQDIAEQLGEYGFMMGHEPDSYELSTLGGWVATNASGMKKNRYGNIEDLVLGITAVTAHGLIDRERTPARESVGGDPARWLLGSEGRLGIVTRCVVKIFSEPEVRRHGSVLFKTFEDGVGFLRDVEKAGVKPASIRLMDNLQFQFGQALKPRAEGLAAVKSKLEKAVVTRIKGFEVDKMVACTLLFEGNAAEIEAQEKGVYPLALEHGGMKAGATNGERGYQLTFSIAYIRDFMNEHKILAESFETCVPWSEAVSLCQNVKQRVWQEHEKRGLPGTPFISCRLTQLYETGVCIYFYFALASEGVENPSDVYMEIEGIARDEILRSGGSLSHHHGIGKLRQRFLPQILSQTALDWRRSLKESVDPDNIFGCNN